MLQLFTLQDVTAELQRAGGARERTRLLLEYARQLPRMAASERTMANRVMGCTSQVQTCYLSKNNGLPRSVSASLYSRDIRLLRGTKLLYCEPAC